MICAWIETSSAETGSSHDDQLRVERERARDADALALAARELVRDSSSSASARRPTLVEQLRDPLALLACRWPMPWTLQRLADDVAGRHARIERGVRVLEDDLHLRAGSGRSSALLSAGDVRAVEPDRAAGRLDQPQQGARRPWTCRSRTRRPAPASRPSPIVKLTPSTA